MSWPCGGWRGWWRASRRQGDSADRGGIRAARRPRCNNAGRGLALERRGARNLSVHSTIPPFFCRNVTGEPAFRPPSAAIADGARTAHAGVETRHGLLRRAMQSRSRVSVGESRETAARHVPARWRPVAGAAPPPEPNPAPKSRARLANCPNVYVQMRRALCEMVNSRRTARSPGPARPRQQGPGSAASAARPRPQGFGRASDAGRTGSVQMRRTRVLASSAALPGPGGMVCSVLLVPWGVM